MFFKFIRSIVSSKSAEALESCFEVPSFMLGIPRLLYVPMVAIAMNTSTGIPWNTYPPGRLTSHSSIECSFPSKSWGQPSTMQTGAWLASTWMIFSWAVVKPTGRWWSPEIREKNSPADTWVGSDYPMIYDGFLSLIQGGDRRDFKKPSTWYDYWYFTVEVGCFTVYPWFGRVGTLDTLDLYDFRFFPPNDRHQRI